MRRTNHESNAGHFQRSAQSVLDVAPEDEKELASRLAGLPPAGELPGGDDLGYRGFIVSNQAGENGVPVEVRIFKGLVAAKGNAGVLAFCDTNELEKWLAGPGTRSGKPPRRSAGAQTTRVVADGAKHHRRQAPPVQPPGGDTPLWAGTVPAAFPRIQHAAVRSVQGV